MMLVSNIFRITITSFVWEKNKARIFSPNEEVVDFFHAELVECSINLRL